MHRLGGSSPGGKEQKASTLQEAPKEQEAPKGQVTHRLSMSSLPVALIWSPTEKKWVAATKEPPVKPPCFTLSNGVEIPIL